VVDVVATATATIESEPMTTATPSTASTASTTAMPRWFVPLLRIDGIGSIVIGVALVAVAGRLAGPLGVGSSLPVVLVGVLFVVNGPVNLRAVRVPTRGRLVGPIAIDSLFGIAMLTVAITDPSGAETWMRWAVGLIALMSLDLAAVKAWGRRRLP
jgi:hypothetical protein